jgi:hypothetical protein
MDICKGKEQEQLDVNCMEFYINILKGEEKESLIQKRVKIKDFKM